MLHTSPLKSWARLTAGGIPPLAVIRRPLRIDFGPALDVGSEYPRPEPGNFAQARRARQFYQQRRIAPLDSPKPVRPPMVAAQGEQGAHIPRKEKGQVNRHGTSKI